MLDIIQRRKIYFTASGVLVVLSIVSLLVWGLKPAIDFTGGTMMELEFPQTRPTNQQVRETLVDLNLGAVNIQPIGEKGLLLRLKDIDEPTHQKILEKLDSLKAINIEEEAVNVQQNKDTSQASLGDPESDRGEASSIEQSSRVIEHKFTAIGPIVGQELKKKTTSAIILVVICIILYVAWAFRKVSKPVQSWKYGVAAIVALIHDILIVSGIFAILGHLLGYEVDVLFVTALLTILGYSVNDTIVVFDRVRENLFRYQGFGFEDTVNRSVNETMIRSLNTSITTLLVLFSIFLFGGVSIRNFVLALICGVIVGTYSSVFIASPLLVVWEKMRRRRL